MDIGRLIREAFGRAEKEGRVHGAIATNIGGSAHKTTVYSDDDITVVEIDGERRVVRHDPPAADRED